MTLQKPPSLECTMTPVLITFKGVESPDSCHIGVIGALVLILSSETVKDKLSSP